MTTRLVLTLPLRATPDPGVIHSPGTKPRVVGSFIHDGNSPRDSCPGGLLRFTTPDPQTYESSLTRTVVKVPLLLYTEFCTLVLRTLSTFLSRGSLLSCQSFCRLLPPYPDPLGLWLPFPPRVAKTRTTFLCDSRGRQAYRVKSLCPSITFFFFRVWNEKASSLVY